MRRRNNHVSVWLLDTELAHLKKQAGIAGLKQEQYLRKLILGEEIKPRPPAEWPELVRQVSAIGNNINQLARRANSEKVIGDAVWHEASRMQAAIWEKVKGL